MINKQIKLSKAPLQEVIFEIRWDQDIDQDTNQVLDRGFELAQGLFANAIETEFPFYKRLIPNGFPVVNPYILVHQFRKSEGGWPVIQFGPSIMTVNDIGKNYVWENSFKPMVSRILYVLQNSYKKTLPFNNVSLRYIDAVDLPAANGISIQSFIESNFKLKVQKDFSVNGAMSDINITEVYHLSDGTRLIVTIGSGTNGLAKTPAIIWQTAVTKSDSIQSNEITNWLEMVHGVVSPLFKSMLKDHFYDSFK